MRFNSPARPPRTRRPEPDRLGQQGWKGVPGDTVSVAFQDLQEMQNDMREAIDQGMHELQEKQGQGGLPAAPAGSAAAREESSIAAAAPPPPQASECRRDQPPEAGSRRGEGGSVCAGLYRHWPDHRITERGLGRPRPHCEPDCEPGRKANLSLYGHENHS